MSALKIFNDPVHGFIEVPNSLILQIIDHPFFQRLRRIKQLGVSSVVYSGGVHTRFSHALGAMHLMSKALKTLRDKGVEITNQEFEASLIAILLHDIGHGPFSHTLEFQWLRGLSHEEMTMIIMSKLNCEFDGKLGLALDIFNGNYPKNFLHQLISGQLDMDRMDYLMRDSFFTGVIEGLVATDRIISTLNAINNQLVVEQKGIYSIEKFIIARRLMYWQVYLHKTSIAMERMLNILIERARYLYSTGKDIWICEHLAHFFEQFDHKFSLQSVNNNHSIIEIASLGDSTDTILSHYTALDDNDILYAIKKWQNHPDPLLSELSKRLLNRKILKIRYQNTPFNTTDLEEQKQKCRQNTYLQPDLIHALVFTGKVENRAYFSQSHEPIFILAKDGSIKEFSEASDWGKTDSLNQNITKYYICYP